MLLEMFSLALRAAKRLQRLPLSFIEARLDYLAQHMQQKLVGFLNSRR